MNAPAPPPAGSWLRLMVTPAIARPAAQVSLVVGTLLNAVNQGPELLHHGHVSWPRVAMNYVVPWCVSAFSAARQAGLARRAEGARRAGTESVG